VPLSAKMKIAYKYFTLGENPHSTKRKYLQPISVIVPQILSCGAFLKGLRKRGTVPRGSLTANSNFGLALDTEEYWRRKLAASIGQDSL
jgi:hypothetical protein